MRLFLSFVLLIPFCSVLAQQATSPAPLNLMPLPSNYQAGNGQLPIDQSFSVSLSGYKEARLDSAVVLRFDVARSPNLPEAVKRRLADIAGSRMTRDGFRPAH